ncbi:MAG: phospholipase C, phosphocholine-specific [Alphaproteobacteria bacterium]|nr:phospholipase C, phosphocholine-specific [Alphaproteobacteria bacterium]
MSQIDRRHLLLSAVGAAAAHPAIARALTIDADVRRGTLQDVDHVVILMQENRAFDHYFGALNGVRGFADRFPIPVADIPGRTGKTVWTQANGGPAGGPPLISPFPLNTVQTFAHMRVEGTPHSWSDAQGAWDQGRMDRWPQSKGAHAMGYYQRQDLPFQYALADAFTLCDAYHCATQTGTNTNRLFLWSATNDPAGTHGGPSISNSHDNLASLGGAKDGYRWSTYAERLTAAGVSWRVYQDMADNFTDNPMAGFQSFRDSYDGKPGSDPRLAALGLSTRKLDGLREDVLNGTLPQVSYLVAPAAESEHPGPSSPAQGADYTARVLDALTANPKVWARTALLLMFDENDGFFDHVPPPAPPSRDPAKPGAVLGGSTVDTTGEYHQVRNPTEAEAERDALMGRPYGLGPRVPLYVISPWSRGGWVNSQVFDHTSVVRFLEERFGVMEPNISPWRRAVCGDLTTAFDFKTPNTKAFVAALPATQETARRAGALPGRTVPPTPPMPLVPTQAAGPRLSRALPYHLEVAESLRDGALALRLSNAGQAGAVLHVYDRLRLDQPPRRYTLEPGKSLEDVWPAGRHDLWILGPNGFHRHLIGGAAPSGPTIAAVSDPARRTLTVTLRNDGPEARRMLVSAQPTEAAWTVALKPGQSAKRVWSLASKGGWYDLSARIDGQADYLRRFAGRLDNGSDSFTDPLMSGPALMEPSA